MDKNNGFTLIELLVVTTVILIFSGLSLARYNDYTSQLKLKNEAKKLVDVLELAKRKAITGDMSKLTCNGGLEGYEVNIQTNSYTLNLRCALAPTSQLIATYNFPNSNIIIQSGGTGLFRFKQLGAGLEYKTSEVTIPVDAPIIYIKNSVMSKCVTISISSIGIVELDEALVGC